MELQCDTSDDEYVEEEEAAGAMVVAGAAETAEVAEVVTQVVGKGRGRGPATGRGGRGRGRVLVTNALYQAARDRVNAERAFGV